MSGPTSVTTSAPAGSLPVVDVIVNNHNYGRFLRAAIESALAQTHERVNVIVVDDGSTDDSRAIIESFGERIVAVLKPNGGQAVVHLGEAGFDMERFRDQRQRVLSPDPE